MSDQPAIPPSFEIGHLRDIFKLPTDEQVSTCIDELKTLILSARAQDRALSGLAAQMGGSAGIEWPETVKWTDDGEGRIGTRVHFPSGEVISIDITP